MSFPAIRKREKKITGRYSRTTGIVYLTISLVFLLAAYITRYVVFELASMVSLFLGVMLTFSKVELNVKKRIAERAITPLMRFLHNTLTYHNVGGKAQYFPPVDGISRLFIPKNRGSPTPLLEDLGNKDFAILNEGIVLSSIGGGLLELYEEERGNFCAEEFDRFAEMLSKVLVEDFRIAEELELFRDEDKVYVKLKNPILNLCQIAETTTICERVGCPILGSIGEALAKNTNSIIHYENCIYEIQTGVTSAIFRVGRELTRNEEKEAHI